MSKAPDPLAEPISHAVDAGAASAVDTSHLWHVPSFTTVTVSPVTWATQRAAACALEELRYEPLPRAV
jgi:hypothetical protein